MTKEEIRDLVLEIIADIAPDEEMDGLKDEEPLREQLDLDSMDFLDIVLELRKRHKIVVPEEEYPQLRSMASTVEYLTDKL
jgi:acyl carrier protein